jgi:hypothetical protein
MGDIEIGKCDFCNEVKPVERTYLRPSKYVKPVNPEEYLKLYNEGSYFIIIRTCSDCGVPKSE